MAKKGEFKQSMAKVKTMRAAIKRLGIGFEDKVAELVADPNVDLDPKASVKTKLAAVLAEYFACSERKAFQCSECNGYSTDEVDVCPFCGAGGIDDGAAAEKVDLPDDLDPDKTVDALATAAETTLQTIDDLEASVADIIAKRDATSACMWDLGMALKDNHDKQLWRLRKNEDGSPAYSSFREFCQQEIGYERAFAYGLMSVCQTFEEQDVKLIGPSKLRSVMRAPDGPQRKKLLGMARKGATQKEIEETFKQAAAKEARKDDLPSKRAEEAKTPPRTKRFTIARRPEHSEHPLYAETPNADGTLRRATSIVDQPSTTVRISDEFVAFFRVVQSATGELFLIEEWRKEPLGSAIAEKIAERKKAKAAKNGKAKRSSKKGSAGSPDVAPDAIAATA